MREYIDDTTEIQNLYKVGINAPYTKSGYGYLGVLIERKSDGKVQCHECGDFFDRVTFHANKEHGIQADEYKKKHGFPISMGLCSKIISERCSDAGKKSAAVQSNIRRLPKLARKYRSKNHSQKSIAFYNSLNICNEQLDRRVDAIADRLGVTLNSNIVIVADPSLYQTICKRYGSWNNYAKKRNIPHREMPRKTKEAMLGSLREYWKIYGVIPKQAAWGKYARAAKTASDSTIRYHFGSWRKALACAGISE